MDTPDVLNPITLTFPPEFFTELDRRIRKAVAEVLEKPVKEEPEKLNYLTRHQVAALLHVSLPTVDSYARKGLLKPQRIGTRILFDEERVKDSL